MGTPHSQSSSITGISPSDCLVSYTRHSLGESYSSVDKQSVYSVASADCVRGHYFREFNSVPKNSRCILQPSDPTGQDFLRDNERSILDMLGCNFKCYTRFILRFIIIKITSTGFPRIVFFIASNFQTRKCKIIDPPKIKIIKIILSNIIFKKHFS